MPGHRGSSSSENYNSFALNSSKNPLSLRDFLCQSLCDGWPDVVGWIMRATHGVGDGLSAHLTDAVHRTQPAYAPGGSSPLASISRRLGTTARLPPRSQECDARRKERQPTRPTGAPCVALGSTPNLSEHKTILVGLCIGWIMRATHGVGDALYPFRFDAVHRTQPAHSADGDHAPGGSSRLASISRRLGTTARLRVRARKSAMHGARKGNRPTNGRAVRCTRLYS